MSPHARTAVVRTGFAAWLGLMLLMPTSCGFSDEGPVHSVLKGGSLFPDPLAHGLTPDGAAVLPAAYPGALPLSVDLRDDLIVPPVQDQRFNSCVAWSLAYYTMTAVQHRFARDSLGVLTDITDPHGWFSPDYLYSQRDRPEDRAALLERLARRADPELRPDPWDAVSCVEGDHDIGCMRPEQALHILVNQGCARWTWVCGEAGCGSQADSRPSTTGPTADADLAGAFPLRCYVRFGRLHTLDEGTCHRMREWLHLQGTPIPIVVKMYSGWVNYRGETRADARVGPDPDCQRTVSRGVCRDALGQDLQGFHMMTVIGYDDTFPGPDAKGGSFLVVNQWGRKWGDEGYMWIPYAELGKIWAGGYGLIAMSPKSTPTAPGPAVCVQDELGKWQVAEDDDVPIDAQPPPAPDAEGGGAPAQDWKNTARPLAQFPAEVSDHVGGGDLADWFTFEVGEDSPTLAIDLQWASDSDPQTLFLPGIVETGDGGGVFDRIAPNLVHRSAIGRLLGLNLMKLTSESPPGLALVRRGVPATSSDPSGTMVEVSSITSPSLCSGTYFVEVAPNRHDLYDRVQDQSRNTQPRLNYRLALRVAGQGGTCADVPGSPLPGTASPSPDQGTEVPIAEVFSVPPNVYDTQGPEPACLPTLVEERIYRFSPRRGRSIRVSVPLVGDQKVHVIAGIFNNVAWTDSRLREVESRVLDRSGSILLSVPPQWPCSTALVVVRDIHGTCGAGGCPAPNVVEFGGPPDAANANWLDAGDCSDSVGNPAFLRSTCAEFGFLLARQGDRFLGHSVRLLVQATSRCQDIPLGVRKWYGGVLDSYISGFVKYDLIRSERSVLSSVSFPAFSGGGFWGYQTVRDDIWIMMPKGVPTEPSEFRLRVAPEYAFRGGIPDGNDSPVEARTLPPDQLPHQDFDSGMGDLDFFRVRNDSSEERAATITLRQIQTSGSGSYNDIPLAAIELLVWDGSGGKVGPVQVRYDGMEASLTAPNVPAQAALTILIRDAGGVLQGATYEVNVEWSPK